MATETQRLEVPQHVLDYLGAQHALTLAAASPDGIPRATTLVYVNDGTTLYVWTRSQAKTAQLVDQNPLVGFAIDEYHEDPRQTKGIQGSGTCEVVLNGEEIAKAAMLFGDKFPTLTPGSSTSGLSFFRISPFELQFIDNASGKKASTPEEFGIDYHKELVFSVLENLPASDRMTFAGELQQMEARAGEVIVRQGGPADKFFIVMEGEAEVVREKDGSEETVATLKPGEYFGEVAIMRDLPRSASVKAVSDTKLLALDRDAFRKLVAHSLGTTDDFDRLIGERLGKAG
jgi:uncharacterized protein YhbP (UPF0306 family)